MPRLQASNNAPRRRRREESRSPCIATKTPRMNLRPSAAFSSHSRAMVPEQNTSAKCILPHGFVSSVAAEVTRLHLARPAKPEAWNQVRASSRRLLPAGRVGTCGRVFVRPANPPSLYRIAFARPVNPVGTRCVRPFRPATSVPLCRIGAVRTENGLPPRPEAAFRPKTPSQRTGTPLSDLPPPLRHAQTPLPAPPTPFPSAQTAPSDLFSPLPATQPTQPKPVSHKRAQRAQKSD